jgi:DNA-binding response OmpR family regulator
MAAVLIVEDEAAIADLIELQIRLAGHTADVLRNGDTIMDFIQNKRPDILILDVMLPREDGFSIMQKIKPLAIPVIFLTAKAAVDDRVTGLKLGADDYIVKPFAAIELIARIETVLRRCMKDDVIFRLGNVEVRPDERIVYYCGDKVELTAKEFELLRVLINNKNLALTRDKLLELVWGFDYAGETRTVDAHIQKLRKKLGFDEYIKTVFKYGYRLEVPR